MVKLTGASELLAWTEPGTVNVYVRVSPVSVVVPAMSGLPAILSAAEANYSRNGVYLASDISNLNSAKSAATIANVLIVSSVVLAAAGGVLAFAF